MRVHHACLLAFSLLFGAAACAEGPATDLVSAAGEKQMLENPGTELAGARVPDVVIVEYFDYNCPYCKNLAPTFEALLGKDAKVAILYKDWPILGPVSRYAAASALAARWQGKYLAAHDALIRGPRLGDVQHVDAELKRAGIEIEALRKDRVAHAGEIDALLKRNDEEAAALGLQGTPGLVVGRELVHGSAGLGDLQTLVERARKGQAPPRS